MHSDPFTPTGNSRPASTRTTSPLLCSPRSKEDFYSADGKLPSGIDPDDLATTLLATLQGGLLLAQVRQDPRPFETAINTLLALAIGR